MSTIYDNIVDTCRKRLPGATDTAMLDELYDVLDEFLQDSNVWQESITLNTTAGDTTYSVVPYYGTAHRLMRVEDANGYNVNVTMEEPGSLVFTDDPDTAEYTVVLANTLTRGEDQVPEWIVKKYHIQLADGLLYRMMSQPAKPFSNERLSVLHGRKFRNGIARARVEGNHKNTYNAQRWQYPQSFATSRRR